MRNVVLTLAILCCYFLTGFSQAGQPADEIDCKTQKEKKGDCLDFAIQNSTTTFPFAAKAPDYLVKGYQVKVGFPTEKNSTTIWVKGSERYPYAQIFSTQQNALSKVVKLSPPYYIELISIANSKEKVKVEFGNKRADLGKGNNYILAQPISWASLNQEEEKFSILFYGCFQPFIVDEETGKADILHAKDTLNYSIRQAFTEIAQEHSVNFVKGKEENSKPGLMLNNPKLVIGTGDQIYTDAGYGSKEIKDHPLSGWAYTCSDPYPLLDTVEYEKHLNRCYRHFNSFDCFEKIYAKLPSINVWDDHEIRDGWGSHGDEYDEEGQLTEKLKPYFLQSKQAFIQHQILAGPQRLDPKVLEENLPLHQEAKVNGINIFSFDLRSHRNSCMNQVIDSVQFNSFKNWCNQVEDGKEVIIVSSIPMFYKSSDITLSLAEGSMEGEARDDIIDSWASMFNEDQRDSIFLELIKLRKRNVKPIIISGDVHIGGMISVWYETPEKKKERLCYEFIYSGLSHETLGESRSLINGIAKRRTKKVKKRNPDIEIGDINIFPIFELTKSRLNFGAIEFTPNQNTIASLFFMAENQNQIKEMEFELRWEETFKQYWKRGKRPLAWYLIPTKWNNKKRPAIPFNTLDLSELK